MINQGVSNERKKELAQLDPFQKNVLASAAFLKENQKALLLGIAVVVGVIAVFFGVMISFERSERNASDLLARAMTLHDTLSEDPMKAFEGSRGDFQKILDEYANTAAGKMTHVIFAKACMAAGEYDKALALYTEAQGIFKNQSQMQNFLLSAIGHVHLAGKDMDQALTYFEKVEQGSSDLLRDEARFILAGIHEARNNTAESQALYEKLATDHKESLYSSVAQGKAGMAAQ